MLFVCHCGFVCVCVREKSVSARVCACMRVCGSVQLRKNVSKLWEIGNKWTRNTNRRKQHIVVRVDIVQLCQHTKEQGNGRVKKIQFVWCYLRPLVEQRVVKASHSQLEEKGQGWPLSSEIPPCDLKGQAHSQNTFKWLGRGIFWSSKSYFNSLSIVDSLVRWI